MYGIVSQRAREARRNFLRYYIYQVKNLYFLEPENRHNFYQTLFLPARGARLRKDGSLFLPIRQFLLFHFPRMLLFLPTYYFSCKVDKQAVKDTSSTCPNDFFTIEAVQRVLYGIFRKLDFLITATKNCFSFSIHSKN